MTMLEITQHAASVIAAECGVREVPATGGLRIAPKASADDGKARSLGIAFVASPQPSDTVVHAGEATVFLAEGVERMVGERVLDAEDGASPPHLVLRSRPAPG
ncbi:MAG TPA: hypothetical protein VGN51_24460 [Acidimicrobiia bacterium]|jgi:hypothetical protein